MFKIKLNQTTLQARHLLTQNEKPLERFSDNLTFILRIYWTPPEQLLEPETPTVNTQQTGQDVAKYDKANLTLYEREVKEHVKAGQDIDMGYSIGDCAGMTASQVFQHYLVRYQEAIDMCGEPDFSYSRFGTTAVMAMRVGFARTKVKVNTDHVVTGIVVDAAADGSQVRLLFQLPPMGYEHLANQRYLVNHSAQWFNLSDGTCTKPDTNIILPDFYYEPPIYRKPGLRA